MIKLIDGYEGRYGVDEQGNVYSYLKKGSHIGELLSEGRLLKTYSGNNEYILVGLSKPDKTRFNALVHRLVAQAFIPNPNNLPEVDHIDNNPQNNNVNNLQWVTRCENMTRMLKHSSPVRNYKCTALYNKNELIGYFLSITAACKYASSQGVAFSSLQKYRKTKGWRIESVSTIPTGSSFRDEYGNEVVPEFNIK